MPQENSGVGVQPGDTVTIEAKVIRVHGNPNEPDYYTAQVQLLDGQGLLTNCGNFVQAGPTVNEVAKLHATVSLDTSKAEQKLDEIAEKIAQLPSAASGTVEIKADDIKVEVKPNKPKK